MLTVSNMLFCCDGHDNRSKVRNDISNDILKQARHKIGTMSGFIMGRLYF